MNLRAKAGIVTAIGALAVAGPAVAEACTPGQHGQNGQQGQQGQVKDQQGSGSDHGQFARFGRRGRSFGQSEFGTLVSWNATQTGTNTYSGSITVSKPAFTAHWARKGSSNGSSTQPSQTATTTQVTYTFTNAKVFFGEGANPPAAGDLVKVIGARLGHCKSMGTSTSTGTTTTSTGTTTTSTGTVRAIFIAAPRTSSNS